MYIASPVVSMVLSIGGTMAALPVVVTAQRWGRFYVSYRTAAIAQRREVLCYETWLKIL